MRLAALLLALLLSACGGGGDEAPAEQPPAAEPPPTVPQDSACSAAGQRGSLRTWMEENYYWPVQAGNADAAGIDGYFRSLLYAPQDRYSYSEPLSNTLQGVLGRRTGYGYTLAWDGSGSAAVLRMRNIEPQSPMARAGVRRGDTVLGIDGQAPAAVGSLPAVTTTGVAREFHLRDAQGAERRVTVLSEDFALSAVPATATFTVQREGLPVKVGYFAYQQFATYGYLDLGAAIRSLAGQGVTELVVDLRYNGGGSVNLSRDLASMMAGARGAGQTYAQLRYSARNAAKNLNLPFLTLAAALPAPPIPDLSRVVVITSPATASASELFINGLRPLMPVVLVGDTTYGKPYGFSPREACGTTFNAVNFETFNGLGLGNYSAGFTPDCRVPDDLGHALGDAQEARIRAALYYIANGRCEAAPPQSAAIARGTRPQALGETTPAGMFAD